MKPKKNWALFPPPQALKRPYNRKMGKTGIKKQNTGLKSHRRRPKCGPITVKWKKHGYKSKMHENHPRRPKCGPITVDWKKHGYKSKTLGFIAAPAGLIAAP